MSPEDDQRLPDDLANQLPEDVRDALQHPSRRQILRVLPGKASASDLVRSGHVPFSVSSVSYHLRVLEESGLVEEVERQQSKGSVESHFSSRAADLNGVAAALRATLESDRQHFANQERSEVSPS
jgi:DNA-binding transcriptional ArsR family regulator